MEIARNPNLTFREIFAEFFSGLSYNFFDGFVLLLLANSLATNFSSSLLGVGLFTSMQWMHAGYSACHFNPIITIACLLSKNISATKAGVYILAQFLGCYVGSLMLLFYIPTNFEEMVEGANVEAGCPHLNPELSPFCGFFIEFLGGLVLTLVFMFVYNNKNLKNYTPCIAAVYGTFKMTGNDISGATLNPFRFFGAAFVSFAFDDFYVYLLAPILGSIIAVFLYKFLKIEDEEEDGVEFPDNNSEMNQDLISNTEGSKLKGE